MVKEFVDKEMEAVDNEVLVRATAAKAAMDRVLALLEAKQSAEAEMYDDEQLKYKYAVPVAWLKVTSDLMTKLVEEINEESTD